MSDQLEWRERLESAHKQMQDAMTEMITKKDYSKTERLLHVADKLMVDLIEDMGGASSDPVYGRDSSFPIFHGHSPSTRRRC
jgi:hypothetical protein